MNNDSGKIERLDNWEKLKIKEACSQIFSGGTPNTNKKEYWNGPFPWLSSGETSSRFIRKTNNSITELGVENSSTRLAKAGSSVIASAGQGHTRGQVSYLLIDTYINQSLIALFPKEGKLDSKFLFYILNMKYERLRQISDDHSIRGSLTTKVLGEEIIELPSIHEQKAIAKILSDLDAKIELNQKMHKTLEAIAQAIFKHWFIDFEFPNEEGKPYKSSGGEMVDSELGEIPKGWNVTTIGQCVKIIGGSTPRTSESRYWEAGTIFWTTPKDLSDLSSPILVSTERKISVDGLISIGNRLCRKGSLLLSSRAPIGYLALANVDTAVNQGIIGILPDGKLSPNYMYLWCKKNMNIIKDNANGSTFAEISKSNFRSIKIIFPDIKLLNFFDEILSGIYNKMVNNTKQSSTLLKIRDLLIPRLMSGKIRVSLEE